MAPWPGLNPGSSRVGNGATAALLSFLFHLPDCGRPVGGMERQMLSSRRRLLPVAHLGGLEPGRLRRLRRLRWNIRACLK